MHRSLAPAVAVVLLLTPAAADAATRYYVDVTVRKGVLVETTCPDGSRRASERSTLWSASGSGELPGDAGIVQLLEERLTAQGDFPTGGEPVKSRDLDLLRERDRGFGHVVSLKGNRVVIDLGRFSPVERKLRIRPGRRKPIEKTIKERVETGEPDADGCTATTIRITDVFGSVQRDGS
jgi:hypothetical protein